MITTKFSQLTRKDLEDAALKAFALKEFTSDIIVAEIDGELCHIINGWRFLNYFIFEDGLMRVNVYSEKSREHLEEWDIISYDSEEMSVITQKI